MIRRGSLVLSALVLAGCGGDGERAGTTEPGGATTTPARTSPPAERAPTRGRSVRSCAALWNADALSTSSYQVTANEFVAKIAPVRVHVLYQRGDCLVVWPLSGRRIEYAVAPGGRRPFGNPERRALERGERVPYNGRADREGRVALD
jgi:hypothetical protein